MIYFKNVPQYGDLEIEKVLFLFDNIPMIFVCRDDKKRYFLCQCVDVIDKFSWMITPVQKRLLISMMKDEISVLSAFKDSGYDIILADEPTGNLDSAKRDELLQLLRYMNEQEEMTILVVTHDSVVAQKANRVLHMMDGKIVNDEVIV